MTINALHAKRVFYRSLSRTSGLINPCTNHPGTRFFTPSCYHAFDTGCASFHSLIYSFHHSFFHSLVNVYTHLFTCTFTKHLLSKARLDVHGGPRRKNCTYFRQEPLHFHLSVSSIALFLFSLSSTEFLLRLRDQNGTRPWGVSSLYFCDCQGSGEWETCSQHFPAKW